MNIGFYDPISERWIKPRPEREPEIPHAMSLGEALLAATEAAALKERNEKIWQYLKRAAEGCNAAPVAEAEPMAGAPIAVEVPPDYVPEFYLGYIYWKTKETA